jgi:hypothetical protein
LAGSPRCGKLPNSGLSRPIRTLSSSAARRSMYAPAASKPWHAKQTFTLAEALLVKSMLYLSDSSAVMPSSVEVRACRSVGTIR